MRTSPLVFFLAVFAVAGCGGSQQESAPAPAPAAVTTAAPAAPAPAPAASQPCDDVVSFAAKEGAPRPPYAADDAGQAAAKQLVSRYLGACAETRILALTAELVRFPTVSADEPATGKSFKAMASFLEGWAKARGLGFNTIGENDAWEVTLGQGPRLVGYVMHADVVPAGEPSPEDPRGLPRGWTHPPFELVRDGDKLYGRGAEDDKGPIASVLVLLAALGQAGVRFDGQLLAILGTGEEHDWDGMVRYAGSQPLPRFTISVDAGFPLIIGESGFVAFWLALPEPPKAGPGSKARIVTLSGGEFLTQVPGEAWMALMPSAKETLEAFEKRVAAALLAEEKARAGTPFTFAATTEDGLLTVTVKGAAVHSSTADEGHNALWPLASLAQRLSLEADAHEAFLRFIAKKLDGDHFGEKLGLAYADPLMGKLLVAPTVLRKKDGQVQLGINMRRPSGLSSADFGKKLDALLEKLKRDVDGKLVELADKRWVGEPALASQTGPLVPTLLEVYRAHTGDAAAQPKTIRGGTYARLFPGAVSFGPSFPGRPYRGHAPDEYVELSTLKSLAAMLLEATVKLSAEQPARTAAAGD